MPQSKPSITRSLHLTIAFLSIFILAFFPGLLQFLIKLPLYPFKFLIIPFGPTSTPSLASSPICPAGCLPFTSGLAMSSSSWFQKTLTLPARSRGSYLITDSIVSQLPEIKDYKVGLLNLFMQHTSCALSMNENWDSEVREDMSDALDRIAPEDKNGNLYRHSAEGPDDMPAHIKSALIGASVTVPISNGKLATGTWQGIWYLEFRTSKHSRKVVATIQGEKSS